jgi:hypothetical protein
MSCSSAVESGDVLAEKRQIIIAERKEAGLSCSLKGWSHRAHIIE